MPLLDMLFGRGAAAPVEAIGRVIDELFTSDEERLGKEALLARLAQRPSLAQIEVNRVEAQHRSVFVAGWRPFIGWICGAALAWNFILRDLLVWAFSVWAPGTPVPAALQLEHLLTVLLSLLGLGGLRTFEKMGGRAK
ncbi:MAG: 3TM-type holin [Defluviicoccus sp.]|nr:3TM-type holin [Defluviicoccus sp.]